MVGQIRFVYILIGPKSPPAALPMSRDQSSDTCKADRSRYIAAKISCLRDFYCMSMFDLGQGSFVLSALAHDLDDYQGTCDD